MSAMRATPVVLSFAPGEMLWSQDDTSRLVTVSCCVLEPAVDLRHGTGGGGLAALRWLPPYLAPRYGVGDGSPSVLA